MKVEKYYCDFCGSDITEDHSNKCRSGEVVISKREGDWNVSSFENCHSCFLKIYEFINGLKKQVDYSIKITCKSLGGDVKVNS